MDKKSCTEYSFKEIHGLHEVSSLILTKFLHHYQCMYVKIYLRKKNVLTVKIHYPLAYQIYKKVSLRISLQADGVFEYKS